MTAETVTRSDPAALSTTEVAEQAHVTYRVLDWWCRTGVLQPSVGRGDGSGLRRRYSAHDVLVAVVLGRLTRLHASGPALRAAATSLGSLEPFSGYLVVDEAGCAYRSDDPGAVIVLRSLGSAWVVDLSAVGLEPARG